MRSAACAETYRVGGRGVMDREQTKIDGSKDSCESYMKHGDEVIDILYGLIYLSGSNWRARVK